MADLAYADFDWDNAKQIGMGAIAKVYLVKYLKDEELYAVKAVSKTMLVHEGKVASAFNEKAILTKMKGVGEVCQAVGTFQTEEELFFVMEYFPRGNLEMLSLRGPLPTPLVASVAAQVLTGMEKIHQFGYVHRDIKLENICIRDDGSVAIIDFDTAIACTDKPVPNTTVTKSIHELSKEEKHRRWTVSEIKDIRRKTQMFAGTAQYISPEMLDSCTWSFASDLWAFGCVIYQLSTGIAAFSGASQFDVFRKIVKGKLDFSLVEDPVVRDICERLLVLNPVGRLGAEKGPGEEGFLESLKGHELFKSISWGNWEHSLMLDACPEESEEYISKMVGSSEHESFDDWIAKKTGPPPSYVPPPEMEITTRPRSEASEEDCMCIEDVGMAPYKPFTFGDPE
eukprot:TRINITY_DN41234_c0_g1_i1.p1 TRINITY_DN41234_c0_g1~~TRINITY_DN41234_c0_g1_i1.p1  ORF type:complete len:406 (+),score=103.90 TRINITY_DN41234_c0_g1_i1:30-1220(+)